MDGFTACLSPLSVIPAPEKYSKLNQVFYDDQEKRIFSSSSIGLGSH